MAQQVAQDDNVRLHISCMLVTIVRVGMQVACDMQVVTNLHDFAWKEALSGPHKLPPDAIELGLGYDGKPVYAIMCKTYAHLLSSPLLSSPLLSSPLLSSPLLSSISLLIHAKCVWQRVFQLALMHLACLYVLADAPIRGGL